LKEGAVPVVEGSGDDDFDWITLEDGVQIQFPPASAGGAGQPPAYRTGDYWLIPARVATGDVEWPGTPAHPLARPPHGVEHAFAPLAIVSINATGIVKQEHDLRRVIKQLWLP
jgi:hypothetical protein